MKLGMPFGIFDRSGISTEERITPRMYQREARDVEGILCEREHTMSI